MSAVRLMTSLDLTLEFADEEIGHEMNSKQLNNVRKSKLNDVKKKREEVTTRPDVITLSHLTCCPYFSRFLYKCRLEMSSASTSSGSRP